MSSIDSTPSAINAYELPAIPDRILTAASTTLAKIPMIVDRVPRLADLSNPDDESEEVGMGLGTTFTRPALLRGSSPVYLLFGSFMMV